MGGMAWSLVFQAYAMAKKEFWDQKPPSEWTEKEVKRLLTNSPWAKDAAVEFNMDDMPGGPPGGGPPGGGPPGGGMDGGMPSLKATVRWESAKPIRLATHQQTEENAGDYVVSVTGLTGGGRGGGRGPGVPPDSEDGRRPNRFQPKATLECKGRPAVTSTDSEVLQKDTGTAMLFTYAKESLPDVAECKEILFVAHVGPLEVSAKFLPKDMIYREHLEL